MVREEGWRNKGGWGRKEPMRDKIDKGVGWGKVRGEEWVGDKTK